MNRRELAKNGFLALCGALLGKKVKKTPVIYGGPAAWRTICGKWDSTGNEEGYSLADGTEIDHG